MKTGLWFLSLLLCAGASGQATSDLRSTVDAYVTSHQREMVAELVDLLSIPNVASDRENIRKNADRLVEMLSRRGFSAEILSTAGNPLVYGEMKVPGASRTLLLYAHYDGQPVDPPLWKQEGPWKPTLRDRRLEEGGKEIPDFGKLTRFESDWRLYARSASDDKSPIVALLAALDALQAAGVRPGANLRVILDGEEEAGSPSIAAAIEPYREKLRADLMLILDGPVHPSNHPTLVFGARGNLSLELTVYGPRFALHSGHYGNWVPNPAMRLAQLLASMKDEEGRTTIEGFYDGIEISPEEKRILESVPDQPGSLLSLFGIAAPDRVGESLQEALQYPSLNVRGLRSAYVGREARTIIPDRAIAALDVRLVAETDRDVMAEKILAHIRKQGWQVVEADPDDATRARYAKIVKVERRGRGTNAYRTPMDHPEALRLTQALARMWGEPPVRIRTSGGTVPISPFIRALEFPAISVPIVNFDNNQHSENENLRLGHFFRGIVTLAAVLTL